MKNPILVQPDLLSMPNDLNNYTLRDYFAGQVLSGMMSDPQAHTFDLTVSAKYCYRMADEMLKERSGNDSERKASERNTSIL